MKFKTTQKAVKSHGDAVAFAYCEMQGLFRDWPAIAYTCGVYGWNADIYPTDCGKFAVMGYRPFGRSPRLSFEECKTYEHNARQIWNSSDDYETKKAKVAELRKAFFDAI